MGRRASLFGSGGGRWPLGRGPLALLLLLGVVACDPGGQLRGGGACPLLPCQSRLTLSAALLPPSPDLTSLEVRFCRGAVCVKSGLVPVATGSGSFRCDASGPLTTDCQVALLSSGTPPTARLDLNFAGRLDDFADGDKYTVQVGPPAFFDWTQNVSYQVTPAPDSGCPAQCRSATY